MPFHCDDDRTDRWALETLNELLSLNTTEIVPTVVLKRHHDGPTVDHYKSGSTSANVDSVPLPEWSKHDGLSFQHLTVEMLWWQNRVHKLRLPSLEQMHEAGYMHAWLFHPPIVDAPRMLEVRCVKRRNNVLLSCQRRAYHFNVCRVNLEQYIEHDARGAKPFIKSGCGRGNGIQV